MIHTDEDDEFARIERENSMKGQDFVKKWSCRVNGQQNMKMVSGMVWVNMKT